MIRTTLWNHPDVIKYIVEYIISDHVWDNKNIKNILILTTLEKMIYTWLDDSDESCKDLAERVYKVLANN